MRTHDKTKTLGQMTVELRAINIEKGFRSAAGGPGDNTFGDYLALLHSEISEALEAYRDWKLDDATGRNAAKPDKPEGVGSELADVLIRLFDMCDVFGLTPFDMDMELADVSPISLHPGSFGDRMALLHFHAAQIVLTWRTVNQLLSTFLRALVTVSEVYGIDLTAEYERKIAYNRTRSFQHGGRTLAAAVARPKSIEGGERPAECPHCTSSNPGHRFVIPTPEGDIDRCRDQWHDLDEGDTAPNPAGER